MFFKIFNRFRENRAENCPRTTSYYNHSSVICHVFNYNNVYYCRKERNSANWPNSANSFVCRKWSRPFRYVTFWPTFLCVNSIWPVHSVIDGVNDLREVQEVTQQTQGTSDVIHVMGFSQYPLSHTYAPLGVDEIAVLLAIAKGGQCLQIITSWNKLKVIENENSRKPRKNQGWNLSMIFFVLYIFFEKYIFCIILLFLSF